MLMMIIIICYGSVHSQDFDMGSSDHTGGFDNIVALIYDVVLTPF